MSAAAGQCGQDSDELNFDFGRYFVSWALNSGYEKVSGQRTNEAVTSNPSTITTVAQCAWNAMLYIL